MDPSTPTRIKQWRLAWICLVIVLGLHVVEETLTGFLPLYNEIAGEIRARYSWIPLPTFAFPVWLGGLALGVLVLLSLTRSVSGGAGWMRVLSLLLAILMIVNALIHLGASVYWGRFAPGVFSSPFLLVAAVALLITAARAKGVES